MAQFIPTPPPSGLNVDITFERDTTCFCGVLATFTPDTSF